MMKRKWSKLIALLLVFGMIAAACGGGEDEDVAGTTTPAADTTAPPDTTTAPPTTVSPAPSTTATPEVGPTYGGRITLGLEAESVGLRPWEDAFSSNTINMTINVFDKLFELDADFQPTPWLASGISGNDDFSVWTMTVREGVVFHNGDPFNAQTVADMFPVQQTGAISGGFVSGSGLFSVEATGEFEVTYTLGSQPVDDAGEPDGDFVPISNSAFPAFLTLQPMGVVFHPGLAVSDSAGQAIMPVGTGPFVIASRDIDNETVMVRNNDYWMTDQQGNQLPYLDEIAFRPIPDEGTRLSSLVSGTVNAINSLRQGTIRDLRDVAESNNLTLLEFQGSNSGGGMFNVLMPPFDDVRVRRGLTHLNNQDSVIKALGGEGISLPGSQWFSPDSPWYSQAAADAYPQFDIAAGTALLQEYVDDPERSDGRDVGSSIQVELSCPPDPTLIAAMQVIEAVWTSTDLVDVELTQFDQATHINNAVGNVENGFVGIHQAHCWRVSDDEDPSTNLNSAFGPPTFAIAAETGIPFSGANVSNYWNPEMYALLQQAIQTDVFEERYDLYEQVMITLNEDVPIWFSGYTATVLAVAEGVTGLTGWVTPDGVLGAGVPASQGRWQYVQINN